MLVSYLAKTLAVIGLAIWVVGGVLLGQIIAGIVIVSLPGAMNNAVESASAAALGYALAIAIVVGSPLLVRKKKPDLKLLGIHRLPTWSDIGLGILALLPYLLLASAVVWLGTDVLRFINPEVGQEISFTNLYSRTEYVLAFLTLVVVAPFAEELLFRGYFQGLTTKKAGKVAGVLVVALVFGLLHLPGFTETGLVLQWGAAADTFSLGIIVGVLRLLTGSIWSGVVLHAMKNAIAYYFLFIAA